MAKFDFGEWRNAGGPRWLADERQRQHLIPGPVKLVASEFASDDTVTATVGAGGAIAGATSVPVAALSGPIPSGAILDFTGAGKFARLTAGAATGAATLTVEALVQALVAGDQAAYLGSGVKFIPSGTAIGRTIAERNANTGYGPAAALDDEIYLLALDVADANEDNDGVLLRPNAVVKENFLPEVMAETLAAEVLTEIRARYIAQGGVA